MEGTLLLIGIGFVVGFIPGSWFGRASERRIKQQRHAQKTITAHRRLARVTMRRPLDNDEHCRCGLMLQNGYCQDCDK